MAELKIRRIHLAVLVLVAVLVHLAFHYTYLPWLCGDSEGYSSQASILYGSGFTKDPGERTPGYPLFLLGCEMVAPCRVAYWLLPAAAQVVTWVQSALSVAAVVLLYLGMERLQIRHGIAFGLALLFALLVGVQQYAMEILSDNLCMVTMVLSGWLVTVCADRWRRGESVRPYATLGGFAFGAAMLVRPNMMPFWLAVVLAIPALAVWRWREKNKGEFLHLARSLFAGGLLPVLAWLFIHYENTGVVTMSGIVSLTRTSAAYNLFDRVHPRDKVLGEIMVKYYRQTNSDGQTNRFYAWLALDEIEARSQEMPLNFRGPERRREAAIFRYLGDVSNELLWENPGVWAQNCLSDLPGTLDFHFAQGSPAERRDPASSLKTSVVVHVRAWETLCWIIDREAGVILVLYLLTFLVAGVAVRETLKAPDLRAGVGPLVIAAFSLGALACMVAPTVFATYDNRYSVPLIPFFVIGTGYLIEQGAVRFAAWRSLPARCARPGNE